MRAVSVRFRLNVISVELSALAGSIVPAVAVGGSLLQGGPAISSPSPTVKTPATATVSATVLCLPVSPARPVRLEGPPLADLRPGLRAKCLRT